MVLCYKFVAIGLLLLDWDKKIIDRSWMASA